MSKSPRISPKLSWLLPYYELGLTFINPENRIARIGAWSRGKSRGKNEHAALFQDRRGAEYRIWLHTHYYDGDGNLVPFSKIDILRHLAHELAHVEDWYHSPKHLKVEAKIVRAFMRMLESEGYVSEEAEFRARILTKNN